MKKFIILMAFAGLLTACHRAENQPPAGAPGTETGTYQGGGSSSTRSDTNSIIIPQNPNY